MKILYVTIAWTGLQDIIFNGAIEPKGMPGFIKPLKELINRGHEVDLFIIHNFEEYPQHNIKVDWIKEEQLVGNLYWSNSKLNKVSCIVKLYLKLNNILAMKQYDFIYGQGITAEVARVAAKKKNIPFGHRLYGTFLYDYILKNGKLKAKLIHYLEYKAFKSPKSFLLVTEDGSKGNKAYNLINKSKSPSDFYFWINGVDKMPIIPEDVLKQEKIKYGTEPFMFYVARLDRWKKQDDAIRIVKILNDRGYNLKLYIAGQTYDNDYYCQLKALISKFELDEQVLFMGPVSRETINTMCKLAIVSFSLYDMCNMGNVFHEMLSAGAVIVSRNDGSLDNFIKNGENGFLINNLNEAVTNIIKVLEDKNYENKIRQNAVITSQEKMKNWEDRINDEINLIEKYINNSNEV